MHRASTRLKKKKNELLNDPFYQRWLTTTTSQKCNIVSDFSHFLHFNKIFQIILKIFHSLHAKLKLNIIVIFKKKHNL